MNLARLGNELVRQKMADARDARDFGFQQSQAKQTQANADRTFGLAQKKADEEKFTVKEITNADGTTSLVRIKTTGPEGPISGGAPAQPNNPFSAGGKFNNEQGKAAGFTDRMLQSEGVLSGVAVPANAEGPPSPGVQGQGLSATQAGLSKIPGVGNFLIGKERQQYEQAKRDFINAQLRRESGAAIAPSEFENADKQYFPVPGDKPDVIAQKAANRRAAIEAMGREGGPAFKPKMSYNPQGVIAPYGQPAPAAAPAAATAPSGPAPPRVGEVRDGYRFRGGNPGDPASWAKVGGEE
jgi:hypothetical protein